VYYIITTMYTVEDGAFEEKNTLISSKKLNPVIVNGMSEKVLKICLGFTLCFCMLFVVLDYSIPGLHRIQHMLNLFLAWAEMHPTAGIMYFILIYFICTMIFVPGSVLCFGGGLVFGRAFGQIIGVVVASCGVFIAASGSACASFLIGRYVFQGLARSFLNKYPKMKAIDKAIEVQGLKIMFLLRLSPVIPYGPLSYSLGLTSVCFRDYVLSLFGMIPDTVAISFIGSSVEQLWTKDPVNSQTSPVDVSSTHQQQTASVQTLQIVSVVAGIISTVFAVVLLTVYANRALGKAVQDVKRERKSGDEQSWASSPGSKYLGKLSRFSHK